jgi:hypothetical protein
MCPACVGTAALIAGSAVWTGGLAALVTYFARNGAKKNRLQFKSKESRDGY